MNRIKVFIEYIPSGQGAVNYAATAATLDDKGNNISNPAALNTAHTGGIQPFILGVSNLGSREQGGDGHTFWGETEQWLRGLQVGGKYNGFWSLQNSDNITGDFSPPMTFTIFGTNIDTFTMRFDTTLKEWASIIQVDNEPDKINNDAIFLWTGTPANSHTIKIKRWNKPRFQGKITSILIGLTIEHDNSQIKNLIAGSRNTFDNSKPFYGVVPQYGSIELIDTDGNLLELAESGHLKAGLPVRAYFNAPERNEGESDADYEARINDYRLCDYRTEKLKYSYGNTNVSADLSDDILNWNTVFFGGVEDDESNTAFAFFNKLLAATPDRAKIQISIATENYLKDFAMPDGYIPPSNLMEAWNIFCNATAMRGRKQIDGNIALIISQKLFFSSFQLT